MAAAVYAFAVALHSPGATVLAYFASFVCDELDGRFARKFNQCSTLGSGGCWAAQGRGQGRRCSRSRGGAAVLAARHRSAAAGVAVRLPRPPNRHPPTTRAAHPPACPAPLPASPSPAHLPAVLDMVTDRVATTCLLALLAVMYPGWHLAPMALIMLDIYRWVEGLPGAVVWVDGWRGCLELPGWVG